MERLSRSSNWFFARLGQGTAGYIIANLVLLAAEAKWHIITRLMLWDISELKTLGLLLGQTIQVSQTLHTH